MTLPVNMDESVWDFLSRMIDLAVAGEVQGIWFWAAVYLLLVGSYSLWFQARTRNWCATRGRLAQLEIDRFGTVDSQLSDQDYQSTALYTYQVNGKVFQGTKVSPWVIVASHNARFILQKQLDGVNRFADGTVEVFYNPHRPDQSYLIVAGWMGIVLTGIITFFPLVTYWFRFHAA